MVVGPKPGGSRLRALPQISQHPKGREGGPSDVVGAELNGRMPMVRRTSSSVSRWNNLVRVQLDRLARRVARQDVPERSRPSQGCV